MDNPLYITIEFNFKMDLGGKDHTIQSFKISSKTITDMSPPSIKLHAYLQLKIYKSSHQLIPLIKGCSMSVLQPHKKNAQICFISINNPPKSKQQLLRIFLNNKTMLPLKMKSKIILIFHKNKTI